MATPPTIVFDLDGTLVDTARDLVATLNAILTSEGMMPVGFNQAIAMVGSGARVLLESAFASEGRALTEEKLDALFTAFLAHYGDHLTDRSRPYPGAEEILDRFAGDGWQLAVCTNKHEGPARKLLDALGFLGRFAAVAGPDTFGFRKPDPRHLTETIRLAGGSPDNAVMVGDSATDVETALAADVPVVVVDYGYSPISVDQLGATRVISALAELPDVVAGIRRKRRASEAVNS